MNAGKPHKNQPRSPPLGWGDERPGEQGCLSAPCNFVAISAAFR